MDPFFARMARLVIAMALFASCASTPSDRIEENRALFNSYPPEVQAKVQSGQVASGFTEDMVRMALGDPDEVSNVVDPSGTTLMWGYTRSKPGFSVGIGGGSGFGHVGGGAGMSMGTGPRRDYTSIVEFREGRVIRVRSFN